MGEQVCAVVVTYNRKPLLRECLQALQAQTRAVDTILVVDNASTDGTLEMVAEEFPNVQTLALGENLGGAGGFHAGMEWAFEQGFDWIWMMDDDGRPAPTCLALLLEQSRALPAAALGPLCVQPDDPACLSFPAPVSLPDNGNKTWAVGELRKLASPAGTVAGWACFFNGILFPQPVVAAVGLPRREMFIWGDEVEYFKRLQVAGFQVHTVCDALHYHPKDKIPWEPIFSPRFAVYAGKLDWKAFCFFRNLGLITRKYGRFLGASVILRYVYYFLVRKRGNIQALAFFLQAFLAGRREDFSRRVPF